jgi:hypothetical protein
VNTTLLLEEREREIQNVRDRGRRFWFALAPDETEVRTSVRYV